MGRPVPMVVGDVEFGTKQAAKQFIRAVMQRHEVGERITGEDEGFLLDLIALHPAAIEKIGCGIEHIEKRIDQEYGTTECLYIVRKDGTCTDISYLKCIDGENHRSMVHSALRTAILPQIHEFKEGAFRQGSVRCPYTDQLVTPDNCHVDHVPPMTFHTIVALWLKQQGIAADVVSISERADNQFTRVMTDPQQIESWRAFHGSSVKLRILSKRGNLSNSKIEAGVKRKEFPRRQQVNDR
jgi:hypothetical protein